jgi:hypothetical protein
MFTYQVTIPNLGTYRIRSEKELTQEQAYQAALPEAEKERQRLLSMPYINDELTQQLERENAPVKLDPVTRRVVQFVKGSFVDPIEAGIQLFGGEEGRRGVREREESYQEMRKELGETGFEGSRLLGNILSPATLVPGGSALRYAGAGSVSSRVAGGALAGAAGSVLTPVSNAPDDLASFAADKVEQIGLGALLGGLVSGGIETLKGGAKFVEELAKPLTVEGRRKLIQEYAQKLVRPQDRQKFFQILTNVDEIVPGSRSTVAEALSGEPASINLAAAQARLSGTTGGAPTFAIRSAEQQAARAGLLGDETAIGPMKLFREAQTAPIREEALIAANVARGVAPISDDVIKKAGTIDQFKLLRKEELKSVQRELLAEKGYYPLTTQPVIKTVDDILRNPGDMASDITQDVLGELRNKLIRFSDDTGVIDSRNLYQIRKEIADDIAKFATERATTDKTRLASLEINLKKVMDNAIEKAGGTSWKKYLESYAGYSQKINRMQVGRELGRKLNSALDVERAGAFAEAVENAPKTILRKSGAQRFETIGGVVTPEESAAVNAITADLMRKSKANELAKAAREQGLESFELEIPQLLDQTIAIFNAILRKVRTGKVQQLNEEAAYFFANPKEFATLLSSIPKDRSQEFANFFMSRLSPQSQQAMRQLLDIEQNLMIQGGVQSGQELGQ